MRPIALLASLAPLCVLAGCGVLSTGDDGDQKITVGTTSAPSTLDPAESWDSSWELFRNVFQTLLSYPSGALTPEPDAAESCEFTDISNRTYRCRLRTGLVFSDGKPLDAVAVKYSIDRIKTIGVDSGPEGLLGSLRKVEAVGERDLVFHLKEPDATFPFILATPALSLVDPADYPADKIRKGNAVTGSGPYNLKYYKENAKAELVRNPTYKGFAERKNDAVTIRYFPDSAEMLGALRKKQIDVTYRGLAPGDVLALQEETRNESNREDIQLLEGTGTEVRYLAFNPKQGWVGRTAVRQAIAQVIDRDAIAYKIYKGTVDPLYSMVPSGLTGHAAAFFDQYGPPDAAKARRILTAAGITKPVPLTFTYPQDHGMLGVREEFQEIKRELDATGLFEVNVVGLPDKKYADGYGKGGYPVIGNSWFPDFPDPENFIAPFVGEQNALGIPYTSHEITDTLLPESRRTVDRGAVADPLRKAQRIIVQDARLLPLWQGKAYVAMREDISGGERALDPSTIMTMWELHRKTSW